MIKMHWQKIFNKPRDHLVAIELTDTAIRLLEIAKSQNGLQIIAAVQEAISTSAEEALHHAIAKCALTTKKVITALPYSAVHCQTITLAKTLTSTEIEKYCYFAVTKHLGNNVQLDYQISTATNPEQQVIDLVAAPQEHINTIVKLITGNQLIPTIIEVDCFALERVTRFILPQLTALTITINLNVNSLLLLALDQQKIIYTHEQPLITLATQPLEQLTATITNAIKCCLTTMQHTCNTIILAGEYMALSELATKLAAHCHCDVTIATVANIAPEFMLCLGMALRSPELAYEHH